MEYRMILRDRKRTIAILVSLFLVVTGVSGSLITSQGSMVSMLSEAIDLTRPNIEIILTPVPSYLGINYTYISGIAREILDDYIVIGEAFYNAHLDESIVSSHGSIIYTVFAVHYNIVEGPCVDEYSYPVRVGDEVVYYLRGAHYYNGGEEVCVYRIGLSIVSLLNGDIKSAGLSIDSGRLPNSGGDPIEVMVYTGFAHYMNWSLGDVVEFLGNRIKITGLFTYNGGLSVTSMGDLATYPVIIVPPGDLERFLEAESEYGISLLRSYSSEELESYMLVTGITDYYTATASSTISTLPSQGLLPSPAVLILFDTQSFLDLISRLGYFEYLSGIDLIPFVLDLYVTVSPEAVVRILEANDSLRLAYSMIKEGVYEPFIENLPNDIRDDLTILLPTSNGLREIPLNSGKPVYYVGEVREDLTEIVSLVGFGGNNDIVGFSILIITLAILVIGYLTANHVISLSLADLRVYLSLLVARGAPGSRLKTRLLLVVVLLAVLAVLLGNAFSAYTIGYWFYTASGLEDLNPVNIVKSRWLWISPAIILAITIILTYRSSIREVARIKPIEAVRPLETVKKSYRKRRVSPSILLYVFTLSSLIIIVSGGPDELFARIRDYGIAVMAIAFIIVLIGMIGLPFTPLASTYILARHLESSSKLYLALSRLASRMAGALSEVSLHSSLRLGDRIKGISAISIMAFGVALGGIYASESLSAMSNSFKESYVAGLWNGLNTMAGLYSASYNYVVLAVFSAVIGGLALYAMYSSTFKLVEGEVLIMRARGASRGDALRFIYGMFMSPSLMVLASSIVSALGFWFMSIGAFWLASGAKTAIELSLLDALLDSFGSLRPWVFLALTGFYIIILPLIVSYSVVRVRDIAKLLRGRGLG